MQQNRALGKYNIIMFAYNEERNISSSIKSVFNCVNDDLNQFIIIINGSTDKTVQIVKSLQSKYTKLQLIEISLGDKCNAWNKYVHEIAPNINVHFFVDADVYFKSKTFPILYQKLVDTDEANAIAGLPFSGRNKKYYRDLVINGVCLFGNCYGVENKFIKLAREKKFRLPIGLGWIDSIITKAINCDITNQYQSIDNRITHHLEAGYMFNSLSPFSWHDIKLYFNRIIRYEIGKLQEQKLNKLEFNEYPKDLFEINKEIITELKSNKIKLSFLYKILIIKKLKKSISNI